MTSEANRTYLGDRIRYLMGDEVAVYVTSNGEQKSSESEEEERVAYQEIKEELGIPVPIFKYNPCTKGTFKYNITHKDSSATIGYQCGDIILTLLMVNKKRTETSGMEIHGEKIKEVDVMRGAYTVSVQKVKNTTDIKADYVAQWEYEDGYYQLSGKVEEKEFLKIMENIYY